MRRGGSGDAELSIATRNINDQYRGNQVKRENVQKKIERQDETPAIATIKDAEPAPARQRSQVERDLTVRLASASVADAIGLMMRSERHRHYSLADLEWLLLPPLMLDQAMFAYTRPKMAQKIDANGKAENGDDTPMDAPQIAIAMVTWAAVSAEVAAKLDAQKKAGVPHRLAPQEWRSGKEVRVIEAIGQAKAVEELVRKLRQRFASPTRQEGLVQ